MRTPNSSVKKVTAVNVALRGSPVGSTAPNSRKPSMIMKRVSKKYVPLKAHGVAR